MLTIAGGIILAFFFFVLLGLILGKLSERERWEQIRRNNQQDRLRRERERVDRELVESMTQEEAKLMPLTRDTSHGEIVWWLRQHRSIS